MTYARSRVHTCFRMRLTFDLGVLLYSDCDVHERGVYGFSYNAKLNLNFTTITIPYINGLSSFTLSAVIKMPNTRFFFCKKLVYKKLVL